MRSETQHFVTGAGLVSRGAQGCLHTYSAEFFILDIYGDSRPVRNVERSGTFRNWGRALPYYSRPSKKCEVQRSLLRWGRAWMWRGATWLDVLYLFPFFHLKRYRTLYLLCIFFQYLYIPKILCTFLNIYAIFSTILCTFF